MVLQGCGIPLLILDLVTCSKMTWSKMNWSLGQKLSIYIIFLPLFPPVEVSPLVAFCCQVRKDLSITDAHASSSELQFPNKFLRIRQEECNRILKLKMLPRENLVTRFPSGQRRRCALRRDAVQLSDGISSVHQICCWRGR